MWTDCQIGDISLPTPNVSRQIRGGRDIYAGYVRGWGLQFGELQRQISADPLYEACVTLASGRTIQSELNRMNIYLIIRYSLPSLRRGTIVEFGSYKGGSAIFMAALAKRLLPGTQVVAFDTFTGMPPTDKTVDMHDEGNFKDVDLNELREFSAKSGLDNLHFVEGRIEDTAPKTLPNFGPITLCHIDCDTRSAVEFSYTVSKPHMAEGAYWVFDDPLYSGCIGATEAVEQIVIQGDGLLSEQIFPQYVFRYWSNAGAIWLHRAKRRARFFGASRRL